MQQIPVMGQYNRGVILLAVSGAAALLLTGIQPERLQGLFSYAAMPLLSGIFNLMLLVAGIMLPVVVLPVCRHGRFSREMAFASGLFAAGLLDCVHFFSGQPVSSFWLAARMIAGIAAAAAAYLPRRSHNQWLSPFRLLAMAVLAAAVVTRLVFRMPLDYWGGRAPVGMPVLELMSALIIIASALAIIHLGRRNPRRSEAGFLQYALVLFSISMGFLMLGENGFLAGQIIQAVAYCLIVLSVYASATANPAKRDVRLRRSLARLLKRYQTLQTTAAGDRQLARDSLRQVSSEKNHRLVRDLFNQVRLAIQPRAAGDTATAVAQLAAAYFQETFVLVYSVQPGEVIQPEACLGPLPVESFAWQLPLIQMALTQNRSLVVEDLSKPPYDGIFRQSNNLIRSLVIASFPGGSQPIGMIALLSRQPGRFTAPAAASLVTFAQTAATLLEIDQLSSVCRQTDAGLTALYRMVELTECTGGSSQILQAAAELCAEFAAPRAMAGFLVRSYPDGIQLEAVYTKNFTNSDIEGFQRVFAGFPEGWPGEEFRYSQLSSPFLKPAHFGQIRNGRSVELLPIVSQGLLLGLLMLVRDEDRLDRMPDIPQFRALAMIVSVLMERANLMESVREVGFTDSLTGLANRRFFDFSITREIGRTKRYNRPLALLMIDIDFFKNINDTYGHPTGDAVLRELGFMLRTYFRKTDLPARYGGEEFVVILPETSREVAMALAERFRMTIAGKQFITERGPVNITVSIGATSPDIDKIPENSVGVEIVELADQALYRAKQTGRNRVILI